MTFLLLFFLNKSTLLNMTVLLEIKNNIVSVSPWKKFKRYIF